MKAKSSSDSPSMVQVSVTHTRDREMTRAAIISAAEQEFALHGLEGARTEEISARAGVTKAMIFHYFGSKDKLYEAALEHALAPLLISLQQFAAPDVPPLDALRGTLRRILDVAAERPGVPAMLFFEILQNRGAYYSKIGFPSLYHLLATIIENGRKQKVFRAADPWHTSINIVGACCFYYCAARRLQPLWPDGRKALSREMMERHAEEAVDLILQGLQVE